MGGLAGQPNYFIEKIWEGLLRNALTVRHEDTLSRLFYAYSESYEIQFETKWDELPDGRLKSGKIHTIRTGNRWKAGMIIHPVINNRTKNRFQFAPKMMCSSVQNIEITDVSHLHGSNYEFGYLMNIFVYGINYFKLFDVVIDNRKLKLPDIKKLAINDGFDSVEDFFAYFNTDFKGQIIHWTDLKY